MAETSPTSTYKDSVLSNCEGLFPEWLELKTRVERTGGMDRQLSNRYDLVYKQMDRYLQQLVALHIIPENGDGTDPS